MDCFATLAMTTMEEIASWSLSSGGHSCDPLARNDEARVEGISAVIACDKREAFAHGSDATERSIFLADVAMGCFAEPVIGRAFARPLARNDGVWSGFAALPLACNDVAAVAAHSLSSPVPASAHQT